MKRDMDLCRQILLDIESNPDADGSNVISVEYEGRSESEISYHLALLKEAGLLEAVVASEFSDGLVVLPKRLTNAGHEFLDASRNESIWQKAKALVLEKTGGLSMGILKSVVTKLATDAVF